MKITIYERDFSNHADNGESMFYYITDQLGLSRWNGEETVLTDKGKKLFGDIDILEIDAIELEVDNIDLG